MKKLALLVIVAACSKNAPAPTDPASNSTATATDSAAAQATVLKWNVDGDLAGYDYVIRRRITSAHLVSDGVGVVFRGHTLEVTVPNATPDRVAMFEQLVAKPYEVHFASASAAFPLDKGTLRESLASNDPNTNQPLVLVTIDAGSKARLAEFTSHGPMDLVVDGEVVIKGIVGEEPINDGKLSLTTRSEDEREMVVRSLDAINVGRLQPMQPGSVTH